MFLGGFLSKIFFENRNFMEKEFLEYWAELNWKNRFKWQSQKMDLKTIIRWISLGKVDTL